MDTHTNYEIEFVAVAKEVVNLLEQSGGLSSNEFVLSSQKLLPLLYLKASFLPKKESMLDGELESFVSPEHYEYMKALVKDKLGNYDSIIHLEDEFMMNTEDYMHVALSELFADIYQDIGNFILQYKEGDDAIRNDAVWECKYNFDNYWGIRTLILTEHIHRLINSEEFENKEGE